MEGLLLSLFFLECGPQSVCPLIGLILVEHIRSLAQNHIRYQLTNGCNFINTQKTWNTNAFLYAE
jgi:hypothetical protein